MQAARLLAAARQGDIDGALGELALERLLFQRTRRTSSAALDRGLGVVDSLARGGTLGGGQLAQALELLGEQALLAEQPHAHLVERGEIAPTRSREGMLDERFVAIDDALDDPGFASRPHAIDCLKPRGWPWLFPRSP